MILKSQKTGKMVSDCLHSTKDKEIRRKVFKKCILRRNKKGTF